MSRRRDTSKPARPGTDRLSRRAFLQRAGGTGAAVALSGSAGAIYVHDSIAMAQGNWDRTFDIVVVGSGAAGLTSAVVAADLGSSVLVLEKATSPGGTTAKSNRGYWIPANPYQRALGIGDSVEEALAYAARCAYPQLFDPDAPRLGLPEQEYRVLSAFITNAAPAIERLDSLGALRSAVAVDWAGKPFPDHFAHLQDQPVHGRSLVTIDEQGNPATGAEMIRQLRAAAEARGVEILSGYRALRLVLDDDGAVVGLEASSAGSDPGDGTPSPDEVDSSILAIEADKAVILASGGFTQDPSLVLSFQPSPLFGGYSVPTNQGDAVRMATAAGAKIGNMKSAYRAQVILEQVLASRSTPDDVFVIPGDSFLIVNRYGHRVVNEKSSYHARARVHGVWDGDRNEWPNLILFLLFDQREYERYHGVSPIPEAGTDAPYLLTGETWEELEPAIAGRLDTISDRTGGFHLDAGFGQQLAVTVERFNDFARDGVDVDFHRGTYPYDTTWATVPPPSGRLPDGDTWPSPEQANVTLYPLRDTGPLLRHHAGGRHARYERRPSHQ